MTSGLQHFCQCWPVVRAWGRNKLSCYLSFMPCPAVTLLSTSQRRKQAGVSGQKSALKKRCLQSQPWPWPLCACSNSVPWPSPRRKLDSISVTRQVNCAVSSPTQLPNSLQQSLPLALDLATSSVKLLLDCDISLTCLLRVSWKPVPFGGTYKWAVAVTQMWDHCKPLLQGNQLRVTYFHCCERASMYHV